MRQYYDIDPRFDKTDFGSLNGYCLCCLRCNLKKGPNIASTGPEAGSEYRIVALFHPRKQRWQEHFHLQEDGRIEGLSPEGRATARLLDFNAEERVQLRRFLMGQNWRP
jgi:hypothetical protein